MRSILLIAVTLLLAGCGISKREHLAGWYIPPSVKFRLHDKKSDSRKGVADFSQDLTISEETFRKEGKMDPTTFDTIESAIGYSTEIGVPLIRNLDGLHENTDRHSIRPLQETRINGESKVQIQKQASEKHSQSPPKLSKGWKVFWITLLIVVLSGAFLVGGALWPEAYVLFFGLCAIIGVATSSSDAPMSWGERIIGFLACVALALFYYWIYLSFPLLLPAIFIQLALYGLIALIALISYLAKKKKGKI